MTNPVTNPSEILSPQRAYVYLAPVGTTAPVDVTAALDVAWVNVGLTTPDSLSVTTSPQFQTVQSHQSDYETRRIQSSDSADLAVDLQQWNANNIKFAMGGGTITETTTGSGVFKYAPPRIGERVERACVIEVIDGTRHYRWVFPRTLQVEGGQLQMQKGNAVNLALRMAVLGGDDTDAFYVLTDDPAFDPAP